LRTIRRRLRAEVGFDGKFDMADTAWTYDGYVSEAWGMINNIVPATTASLAFSMAMDSILDPVTGRVVCNPANAGFRTGIQNFNLVRAPSECVPFNPFGVGVNGDAARNWMLGSPKMYFHIKQEVAAVNIHGQPFQDWAGPVSVAAGFEHRKESSAGISDPL